MNGPKELDAKDLDIATLRLVQPKQSFRPPCPREVDDANLREDYEEACLVLADSPKASAALSRRCLQHLIHEHFAIDKGNLDREIQALLDQNVLPADIADAVDAVRIIGNFAAHPIKAENTGEIVPVKPGEAEWNLEVLEELFDFKFVRPKRLESRRTALNEKLAEAGKPEMKEAPAEETGADEGEAE